MPSKAESGGTKYLHLWKVAVQSDVTGGEYRCNSAGDMNKYPIDISLGEPPQFGSAKTARGLSTLTKVDNRTAPTELHKSAEALLRNQTAAKEKFLLPYG